MNPIRNPIRNQPYMKPTLYSFRLLMLPYCMLDLMLSVRAACTSTTTLMARYLPVLQLWPLYAYELTLAPQQHNTETL